MTWVRWVLVAYGVLNIVLGILGSLKGSVQSLIFGGAAGLLVLACVWISMTKPRVGYIIAMVIALAVGGRFLMQWMKDLSVFYPNGLIALASIATIIAMLAGHMLAQRGPKTSEPV